jgi:hypothetical protein
MHRAFGVDPNEVTLAHKVTPGRTEGTQPFVLWPYQHADSAEPSSRNVPGFVQVPAPQFAPVFNSSWWPNRPVRDGWDPSFPPSQEGLPVNTSSVAENLLRLGIPQKSMPMYRGLFPLTPGPGAAPDDWDAYLTDEPFPPGSPKTAPGPSIAPATSPASPKFGPPARPPAVSAPPAGGKEKLRGYGTAPAPAPARGLIPGLGSALQGIVVAAGPLWTQPIENIIGNASRSAQAVVAGTAGGTVAAVQGLASGSAAGISTLSRSTIGMVTGSVSALQGLARPDGRSNARGARSGVSPAPALGSYP